MNLTPRQREIFGLIEAYISEAGYPPSVRDICDMTGLASPSTVHAHLANLERAGYIARDPSTARGIRVIGRAA